MDSKWFQMGLTIVAAVLSAFIAVQISVVENKKDIEHLKHFQKQTFSGYGSLFATNRDEIKELRLELHDFARDFSRWQLEHERGHP